MRTTWPRAFGALERCRGPSALSGRPRTGAAATDQVGGDGSCAAWRSRWSWACISLRPSAFCSSRARAGGSPYRERPPSSETRVSLSQRRTLAGNRPCTGDGRSRWPGGKGGVPHSALMLNLPAGRQPKQNAAGQPSPRLPRIEPLVTGTLPVYSADRVPATHATA